MCTMIYCYHSKNYYSKSRSITCTSIAMLIYSYLNDKRGKGFMSVLIKLLFYLEMHVLYMYCFQ